MIDRVAVAGLVLQLIGATLAVIGLHLSKRQLFGGGVWGLRHLQDTALRAKAKLRRKPSAQTVTAQVATLSLGATVRAHGYVEFDNPTVDQRLTTLEQRIGIVESTNEEAHQAIREEADRQERLRQQLQLRVAELRTELHDYTAEAIGGEKGRGLDLAAFGVFLGAVGTALAY